MSNQNNGIKVANGGNNGTNGTAVPVKEPMKVRIQKRWDAFRLSKGGRWAIRGGKTVLAGLGLYGAYKAGQHSVKPVTVYIEHGVNEETKEEEPETAEQPDQEAINA